ncbi:MAG: hypothetical protein H0V82_03500 [Candidatus Protochlamydia sp.]|nr:hypothetical protein [Candidatus Protochlamydia sp.]
MTLVAWAMRTYKKLKGHKTRARQFLEKIKENPMFFAHWKKEMVEAFGDWERCESRGYTILREAHGEVL